MRRYLLLVALAALLVVGASPAASQTWVEHPHMLLIGIEFDEHDNPSWQKCVDLAANRSLRLNSHHDHVHTGTAGVMLSERAGHMVVPGGQLFEGEDPLPWSNCAELAAFVGGS
jgi:hypothetical protein